MPTWNEIAPLGTDWWEFAYTGTRWKTWRELYSVPVYCPSIRPFMCEEAEDVFPTIIVYSDSNNSERIKLYDTGVPYPLVTVTKIKVVLDDGTELDSDTHPAEISWNNIEVGTQVGVVTLRLGLLELTEGIYTAKLIVYDPSAVDGLYWGMFRIRAIRDDL